MKKFTDAEINGLIQEYLKEYARVNGTPYYKRDQLKYYKGWVQLGNSRIRLLKFATIVQNFKEARSHGAKPKFEQKLDAIIDLIHKGNEEQRLNIGNNEPNKRVPSWEKAEAMLVEMDTDAGLGFGKGRNFTLPFTDEGEGVCRYVVTDPDERACGVTFLPFSFCGKSDRVDEGLILTSIVKRVLDRVDARNEAINTVIKAATK